jgi:hypothetical protein
MYKCLNQQRYQVNDYTLIPIREQDKMPIMEWRNAQIDVLRQDRLLTVADQDNYFKNVVLPLFDQEWPKQLLFSFLYKGELIGYGGLVHIHWGDKRAEVSFLLDNKRVASNELYKAEFSVFLTLLKQVAFNDIMFNRLYTETFDIRPFHISILEENGFVPEGRMREHVLIEGKYYDSLIHGFLKEYLNV